MKRFALVFMTLSLVMSMCCVALAQQSSLPSVSLSNAVSVTGTIVAIDKADREVTIQGPQGNTVTVDVDPAVRDFNQLRVGDQVNMTYYESVAVMIGPKGQLPSETTTTRVGRGPAGSSPEGFVVETTDAVATVKAINRNKRTVTLQGPSGDMFTVKVPQSMQGFNQLKVGDSVHARYTEAVAVSVQRP